MQQASAPAPSPRPYDSLLPQLVMGRLTWSGRNEKAQENKSTVEEVWKEEKEEDEDLSAGNVTTRKVTRKTSRAVHVIKICVTGLCFFFWILLGFPKPFVTKKYLEE